MLKIVGFFLPNVEVLPKVEGTHLHLLSSLLHLVELVLGHVLLVFALGVV